MKIGDAAVKFLHENPNSDNCVWYGDPYTVHEIATLAGIRERTKVKHGNHPMNVITKTLNGLEKDKRFEKSYVRLQQLVRCFKLKKEFIKNDR